MDDTFILAPRVTLLSRPEFIEPEHLKCAWIGEATDGERLSEFAGRLCYMSHRNPSGRSTGEYLGNIRKQGHGSVYEHANYSVLFEGVSRSFTHELVRHRAGFAYSQVSQRYVDEGDTQFVVPPAIIGTPLEEEWREGRLKERNEYQALADALFAGYAHIEDRVHRRKTAREAARSVLPNATETKIVATANARAWRTMLELRTGEGAEREMRRAAVALLRLLQAEAPAFFADFAVYTASDGAEAARAEYRKV